MCGNPKGSNQSDCSKHDSKLHLKKVLQFFLSLLSVSKICHFTCGLRKTYIHHSAFRIFLCISLMNKTLICLFRNHPLKATQSILSTVVRGNPSHTRNIPPVDPTIPRVNLVWLLSMKLFFTSYFSFLLTYITLHPSINIQTYAFFLHFSLHLRRNQSLHFYKRVLCFSFSSYLL